MHTIHELSLLHIPFPPPDILTAMPEHEWLVRTLFDYDLIGFQTEGDLGNFRRYVEEHLGGIWRGDGTLVAGKAEVRAGCFPIGIDVAAFARMGRTPEAEEQIRIIRQRTLARQKISVSSVSALSRAKRSSGSIAWITPKDCPSGCRRFAGCWSFIRKT